MEAGTPRNRFAEAKQDRPALIVWTALMVGSGALAQLLRVVFG